VILSFNSGLGEVTVAYVEIDTWVIEKTVLKEGAERGYLDKGHRRCEV
jgi:hypothetical protein